MRSQLGLQTDFEITAVALIVKVINTSVCQRAIAMVDIFTLRMLRQAMFLGLSLTISMCNTSRTPMQAYKLTGKIDHSGKLVITEPTNLSPGDVEVIILQSATTENRSINDEQIKQRPSKVKTFQDWFAKTEPIFSNFTSDDAKWDYLKEKHNL